MSAPEASAQPKNISVLRPSGVPKNAAPKTVLDKVIVAIRALKDHKGSSRPAIAKYLKAELATDNPTALRAALKKGVEQRRLTQSGQSFRVAGEAYEEPADERLTVEEVKVGGGVEATDGSRVTVSYRGTLVSGHQFDAAKSFSFVLGTGEVIKGWDRGIRGMRVGGTRKLACPPKLGYGAKGCAPDIPPNATLHFTVTLKAVA